MPRHAIEIPEEEIRARLRRATALKNEGREVAFPDDPPPVAKPTRRWRAGDKVGTFTLVESSDRRAWIALCPCGRTAKIAPSTPPKRCLACHREHIRTPRPLTMKTAKRLAPRAHSDAAPRKCEDCGERREKRFAARVKAVCKRCCTLRRKVKKVALTAKRTVEPTCANHGSSRSDIS